MLTIQPGIIFSENSVRFMRLRGFTDDDVATDIANLESGEVTPGEAVSTALRLVREGTSRCYLHYVRDVIRASTIDMVGGAL